ncbi:MAG: alpha/beta fold hydrolase [Gammaproteobacteria bacterium]|nr:alpha/beta fold hydrolase [Gammaproteobacteria bacterium]NNK34339.1 alpha/beta fold hydrolase [Xanthomonadales bacterium]
MGKFESRTKYLLIIALLLGVTAGLWLYYVMYSPTSEALRRAESFLFSRMTVNQLGEQGAMRYFFVTNRSKYGNESALEDQFGNERQAALTFGLYDTKVEPSVGLGMFINPSEWFQNEEIVVQNAELLEREAFVSQLRGLVNESPRRSLLLVIHGFKERFPSALRKTTFVGHILDINTPVLVFDWPGNQGSTPRGYQRARAVATESGAELAQTIELIVREIRPDSLWLLANSMGGQVVVHAFHELYADPEFADAGLEIEDVVLTAPDVSHEEFNARFKREIASLARNLTVYVSSNDRALVMSRIVNRGETRLGESTLSPDMLDEAARIAELVEPDNDLVTLVDVTPVNRTRNFHNFSLETPEFFDDLFLRLTNQQTPLARTLHRLETPEGVPYWVLSPGR